MVNQFVNIKEKDDGSIKYRVVNDLSYPEVDNVNDRVPDKISLANVTQDLIQLAAAMQRELELWD